MRGTPWIQARNIPSCHSFAWLEQNGQPVLIVRDVTGNKRVSPVPFEWFSALREHSMTNGSEEMGCRLFAAATSHWETDRVPAIINATGFENPVGVTAQRMLLAADTQPLFNEEGSPRVEAIVAASCALALHYRNNASLDDACQRAIDALDTVEDVQQSLAAIERHGGSERILRRVAELDSAADVAAIPTTLTERERP